MEPLFGHPGRYAPSQADPQISSIARFFSDDAVYIDGPRGVHRGIDAIRTELQSQFAMVSYATVDIKVLAGSGGTVLIERFDNCEIAGTLSANLG